MKYCLLLICAVLLFGCSDDKDDKPASSSGIPSVPDTQDPYVEITEPTNGVRVARGAVVRIKANASDNVGVSYVDFYVGGTLKHRDNNSPYYYDWRVPAHDDGRRDYGLYVKAVDASGNSNSYSITVWSFI